MELSTLHDATLEAVAVDWSLGEAIFTFRQYREGAPGVSRLVVSELTTLHLPREHPWGDSVSVNEVTPTNRDSGIELEIEMQSGDKIVVRGTGAQVTWEPVSP